MQAKTSRTPGSNIRRTRITQYWHPIAALGEITDQPRRFMLLGRPLVAFRDEQGVAVLNDLCIHRGSALSRGWIETVDMLDLAPI